MSAKSKTLVLTLAVTIFFLNFALVNMKGVFSSSNGGKIDLFTQKEPCSGVGANMPSDAFGPGETVILYALVTYNEVPQEGLIVTFLVQCPDNSSFSLTDETEANGIAAVNFSIPQRCANLSDVFGEWFAMASVNVGNNIFPDTLTFRVDWIVKLLSVRTVDENVASRSDFGSGGDVGLEISLRNIAMSTKNAILAIVIQDELAVPVSSLAINGFEVQPNGKIIFLYCKLYIPKWAHIGKANVYVSALTAPVNQGGSAYCPAVSAKFSITLFEPLTLTFHDAAIVKIVPSTTSVHAGEPVYIGVTVRNEGTDIESFNVNTYFNDALIGTLKALALAPYSSVALNFTFDTSTLSPGNYTISAFIPYLISEADLTDNTIEYGVIEIKPSEKQHYLTVRTVPLDIAFIPGEGWYDVGSDVHLTAPEYISVSLGVRYKFSYWDVDGISQGIGVYEIVVNMDANHTATANYLIQYLVTFDQTDLESSSIGTILTVNGSIKTFSDLPYSLWVENGTVVTYSYSTVVLSSFSDKRFNLINVSGPTPPFIVAEQVKVTGNYAAQWQVTFTHICLDSSASGTVVTVNSVDVPYSSLPYTIWVANGNLVTYGYASTVSSTINGKRFYLSNVTGSASPIIVSGAVTVTGNYKTQYYLTVNSPYGTPDGEGWYDSGTTAYAILNMGIVDHENGTRRVFIDWSGDASGTNYAQSNPILMDRPKTAGAKWKTQYKFIVRTNGLGTNETNIYNGTTILGKVTDATSYVEWFDQDALIQLDIDSPIYRDFTRYVFIQWMDDVSGSIRPLSVTLNLPKDITVNYETQFKVTFTQTGLESSATGTVVTVNDISKTFSELPYSLWVGNGAVVTYFYSNVSSTTTGKRFILTSVTGPISPTTVTSSITITVNYKTQFYLTVKTDPLDITTIQGEGWYDQCTNITLAGPPVGGYDFEYWSVDEVSLGVGVSNITVHMDSPHTAKAYYSESVIVKGWYVPDWFFLLLLLLLILIIILLFALLYRRRRKKEAGEAFRQGWTAWYYGHDLKNKIQKLEF